MTQERRGFGNALVIALALALLATAAAARVDTTCGPSIAGPAVIEEAHLLGPDGKQTQQRADLRADQVVLSSGTELQKGAPVFAGETIERGVIVNASDARVWLRFSTGDVIILEPRGSIAIGDAKCVCECTCKTDSGETNEASFPCSSNSDDCDYDGDLCRWTDADGTVHVGRYQACLKVWEINQAAAAQ